MKLSTDEIDRIGELFWSKVQKGPDCWTWIACQNGSGYGNFRVPKPYRSTIPAHRVALLLSGEDLDPDDVVAHKCDNRLCCRPDHLFKTTKFGNSRDAVAKGKFAGENHHHKVTERQVLEIRRLYDSREMGPTALAKRFGLHQGSVYAIVRRRSWRHLP